MARLERIFKKRGIDILTGTKFHSLEKFSGRVEVALDSNDDLKHRTANKVLVAVGRTPLSGGLGLEDLGVEFNRGYIKVDEQMRTANDAIYAIGDVNGPPLLAHAASEEGIAAIEFITGKREKALDHLRIPACIYCQPEIAVIGLSEEQAQARGYEVKIGKFPFRALGKAIAAGHEEGLAVVIRAAIMAGTGKGAERGVLFKNSEALELASKLDPVVLDKTGTITVGKPAVIDVVCLDGNFANENEFLRLAASAERGSEHPLGRAIVAEATKRGLSLLEPKSFKASRGLGMSATVDGREVLAGKPGWFLEMGLDLGPLDQKLSSLQNQGKTVVVIAVENKIAGLIAVADQVKPESREAIESLHKQNIKVVMVTGDKAVTSAGSEKSLAQTPARPSARPPT